MSRIEEGKDPLPHVDCGQDGSVVKPRLSEAEINTLQPSTEMAEKDSIKMAVQKTYSAYSSNLPWTIRLITPVQQALPRAKLGM